jgi:hypothetical protein
MAPLVRARDRITGRVLTVHEGTAMADSKQVIKATYDAGMAEVFKIVGSLDATLEQRVAARQTARDLSSMLVAHTLQTIEGRTALLAGLIVELNDVIASIDASPPFTGAVDSLTSLLNQARILFKEEKQALI